MRLRSRNYFFAFLLLGLNIFVFAQRVHEKPAVLYPVTDNVGILTQTQKDQLNQKLIKFSDSTSTEIAVIIIPTTGGEDVNYLATMYGEKWKIGQKGIDNGIVFLIATEDHTMSIQQGRAVEQYLTASVAGQIMDYIVTPNFKQGLWYEGINRGTTALMEAVRGKFKPLADDTKSEGLSITEIIWIAFFVFIILRFLWKAGGGGGGNGFGNDEDVILSRKGRRSYPGGFFPFPGSFGGGGFGGGSGGGGFGGFGGGGSFGGGGASGGW